MAAESIEERGRQHGRLQCLRLRLRLRLRLLLRKRLHSERPERKARQLTRFSVKLDDLRLLNSNSRLRALADLCH